MYCYDPALSQELQKKAKKELNEIPSQISENLELVRDWLTKQPHLTARTGDVWLLNFLRGCKFSLQRTKEKLDFFYTVRTLTPEFFENRDPFLPEIQKLLELGIILPMELSDMLLVIIRWENIDVRKVQVQTFIKVCMMVFDIALNESNSFLITGIQLVNDFKGFPLAYFKHFTPAMVKKWIITAQKGYPLRIKGIHMVNTVSYVKTIFNIFKPFVSKKLLDRVHFYDESEYSQIHEHIPKSVLPKEYGGEGCSVEDISAELKKKVESYRDWFLEDVQYRSNEKKRPGKPKTSAGVYGVEGSFRKLEVD